MSSLKKRTHVRKDVKLGQRKKRRKKLSPAPFKVCQGPKGAIFIKERERIFFFIQRSAPKKVSRCPLTGDRKREPWGH